MTFSFNNMIPAANDFPGNDQPLMLQNNVATAAIIAVDHVGFAPVSSSGNGQHLQVTFNAVTAPAAPAVGLLYAKNGTAAATIPDVYYINPNNLAFPLNFIRAAGIFTTAGLVAGQGFNVTSVVKAAVGKFNVTLPANVVTGTSYGVIITSTPLSSGTPSTTYVISSSTVFQIQTIYFSSGFQDPTSTVSFMVFQI